MAYLKGIIETVIGTGEAGYAGDGGPASAALLREPFMVSFDSAGNIYLAEARNHCVRRIDRETGVITTIAGNGTAGYSGDGGPAVAATLNEPYSLTVHQQSGDIYIVDRLNAAVRRVDGTTGIITTVAGTGESGYGGDGGPGDRAQLREPNDCFLDSKGGLLIADIQDQRVRRLDLASGIISTFAGNGEKVRQGDGLPARRSGRAMVCQLRRPAFWAPGPSARTATGIPTLPRGRATGSAKLTPKETCRPWRALGRGDTAEMAGLLSRPPGVRRRLSGATHRVTS